MNDWVMCVFPVAVSAIRVAICGDTHTHTRAHTHTHTQWHVLVIAISASLAANLATDSVHCAAVVLAAHVHVAMAVWPHKVCYQAYLNGLGHLAHTLGLPVDREPVRHTHTNTYTHNRTHERRQMSRATVRAVQKVFMRKFSAARPQLTCACTPSCS